MGMLYWITKDRPNVGDLVKIVDLVNNPKYSGLTEDADTNPKYKGRAPRYDWANLPLTGPVMDAVGEVLDTSNDHFPFFIVGIDGVLVEIKNGEWEHYLTPYLGKGYWCVYFVCRG